MNTEAKRAIEAILMVADQPIESNLLAQITEVSVAQVDEICAELRVEYEAADRGFVLARVAGGYRFQSHPDLAPYVERFVLDGQSARMSSAALETLAIVAYKQPISRAQIASIRGVNAEGVIRTLEARGYVHEVGRDPGPGNAVMYGTTATFLEKLGLDSVDQLPPLGAFVPGADVVEQLERTLRVEPSAPDDAPLDTDERAGSDPAGDNGAAKGTPINGTAINGTAQHGATAHNGAVAYNGGAPAAGHDGFGHDDVDDGFDGDDVAHDELVVDIRSNGSHSVDGVEADANEPTIALDDSDARERQSGEP